jgi:tRNA pseudouridine55 synthase
MADRGNIRRRRQGDRAAAKRYGGSAPPRPSDPFDGVLVIDKPAGPTSHDVVEAVRRTFGFKKVGHGGTLDPMATGVLVILIGRGTKLSNHFIGSDKTYRGTMLLGVSTDSHDMDGEVTGEADCSAVTRAQVEAEMEKLTGDMMQVPPMVSAVKVNGVPLYKRARKGQTVEREPRLIHVYEFSLLDFKPPRVDLLLRCTKGTYVRKLCADIGESLGCGACLERLRRTESGDLHVENAVELEEVLRMEREELLDLIIPLRRFTSVQPGLVS